MLQLRIMQALHSSPIGGHSGFLVTYSRICKLFAWRGLKSSVKTFVSSCVVCLQAKPECCRYPGLLSLLLVPSESWQVISMDFIEDLPRSSSANCLIVVVDKFSKLAILFPYCIHFWPNRLLSSFLTMYTACMVLPPI